MYIGHNCILAVDAVDNIFVEGIVYETNDVNATVRGIPLGELHYQVSVTKAHNVYVGF